MKFFGDCVRTNQAFGFLKRTRPEYFATNEYSREKPTFAELSVWLNINTNENQTIYN